MADVKKRIWISLIVLIALATVSQAGTLTWDGGGADNNWSTAANWDTDAIPTAGDTVNISNGDTVMSNIGSWPAGIAVTPQGQAAPHWGVPLPPPLAPSSEGRKLSIVSTSGIEPGA